MHCTTIRPGCGCNQPSVNLHLSTNIHLNTLVLAKSLALSMSLVANVTVSSLSVDRCGSWGAATEHRIVSGPSQELSLVSGHL